MNQNVLYSATTSFSDGMEGGGEDAQTKVKVRLGEHMDFCLNFSCKSWCFTGSPRDRTD